MTAAVSADRTIFRIIFVASLASIAYQITLLRIFSITLWHHFAFLVMSIAMLGIGAGGSVLIMIPRFRAAAHIPVYGLLLAILFPVSYITADNIPFDPARLSWDRMQLFYIMLRYLVLSLPFLVFGMLMSSAYSEQRLGPESIYAADLIGAGLGSTAVLWLLYTTATETIPFILSCLIAGAVLISGWSRTTAFLIICVNALILLTRPAFIGPHMSPYKPLEQALSFPGAKWIDTIHSPHGRIDIFRSPAVRFAPGLSLKYTAPLPDQIGLSIDAGDIHAITDEADKAKAAFFLHLPMGLPYSIADKTDVLILDPKAGLSVLVAKAYGAKNVWRAESNPAIIKAVTEYGRDLSSSIYAENVIPQLGRSWLSSTQKQFDVIECSPLSTIASGIFGFAEDYRFTFEAFRIYLEHLKPNGIISITTYRLPPARMEYRLVATLIQAGIEIGIADIGSHMAAIKTWDTMTIIMKKSPLTDSDIAGIKSFSMDRRFELVYYPGITQGEIGRYIQSMTNEDYIAFQKLISSQDRETFLKEYLFDIRPVSDDAPFFHYYLKWRNISRIYSLMGEKWQFFIEEGYLLPVLLLQALLFAGLLILLPRYRIRLPLAALRPQNAVFIPLYFGCLGLAYLFIEMALIQKMILWLGNAVYATSLVVASMLISSGIGSLAGSRMENIKKYALLLIPLVVVVVTAFLPALSSLAAISRFPVNIILALCIILPMGFLMGMPFPLGMERIGKDKPDLISWAWAVNGCCSVVSPVLAVMIAITAGFSFVLISAACLYGIAYATLIGISSHPGPRLS